jgi:hypothetical protein
MWRISVNIHSFQFYNRFILILIFFVNFTTHDISQAFAQNTNQVIKNSSKPSLSKKTRSNQSVNRTKYIKNLNFKSKRGLGFIQTIGGIHGLGVQWGIGRLFLLETVVGGSFVQHDSFRNETLIGSALGLHFQLMQAQDVVSLTTGLRYNYLFGEICSDQTIACTQGTVNPQNISEHIWDIPLRIMWFPIRYLSIHTEFGISWQQSNALNKNVQPTVASDQEITGGWNISFFNNSNVFGNLSLVFWFI